MKLIVCLLLLLGSSPCFAQVGDDSIRVLPMGMALPGGAVLLGSVKAGDNTTAINCDYEKDVADLKKKARNLGGNLVRIRQLVSPSFIGKCYKVKADVYYVPVMPDYGVHNKTETANSARNYAVLYVYRLKDTLVPTPFYKLHMNGDSVICTVHSKSRDSILLYNEGDYTLWAKTETRAELKLSVKAGGRYYVRCGIAAGNYWMSPVLQQVDEQLGAREYSGLGNAKKDMSVDYLKQVH